MRCFLLIAILAMAAFAQDPTKVAPEAYQLAFENEYVRVQRVHYAPHVKIAEHDHTAYGTAYVYLNDAGPMKFGHIGLPYGAVTRPAVKAGSFRLYKAVKETHTVESLSDTASDFLRVELKTTLGNAPQTFSGKFFRLEVPTNEIFQQVQFENEQVRITRLLCAAGKACVFALNTKEPSLLVALTDIQFKPARGPSGGKPVEFTTGQTRWLAIGKGEPWTNAGKDAAEWLRFDFKTAPLKQAASEPHSHSEDAATSAKKAEAVEHLKRGAALDGAGKLAEAIAAHVEALKLNPELVQAHINLISLYGRARQFAQAEAHYQKALAINPDLPVLHYNFGVLLVGQDRFAEAAPAFQQCLKLDPYYAEAHFNYASLIERENKLDEAAAHYRKAIANQAGYRAAHFGLGRILVNQDNFAEAIEHFQQTLTPPSSEEDEETPRYLYALGATYIRAGEKAKGIQALREALQRATALNQTELVRSLERDLKNLGTQ